MTYVVKKPFRSNGRFYNYGDVVSNDGIANIKLFKSKVGFGKLIAVDEQNASELKEYFKAKYGVELKLDKPSNTKPAEAKPAEAKPAEAKPAKAAVKLDKTKKS